VLPSDQYDFVLSADYYSLLVRKPGCKSHRLMVCIRFGEQGSAGHHNVGTLHERGEFPPSEKAVRTDSENAEMSSRCFVA